MLLFKEYHVDMILSGRKIRTGRMWKRNRAKVGSIHQCRTKLFDKNSCFARVKILDVKHILLSDMTELDAKEEGYTTKEEYFNVFAEIHKKTMPGLSDLLSAGLMFPHEIMIYSIKFAVVGQTPAQALGNIAYDIAMNDKIPDDEFDDTLEAMIGRGEDT